MSYHSAYLLVFHGSRDPRPQQAVTQLANQLGQHLKERSLPIATAALELAPDPLHGQIEQFVRSVVFPSGCSALRVMPLFLSAGVHVMDDIPREIAIAQHQLRHHGVALDVHLHPYFGQHPRIAQLVAQMVPTTDATATILVAHGTRRVGGNQPVHAIAASLGATVAYWAIPPDLPTQVRQLMASGHRQIAIVPYFLFPGGTLDAIATLLSDLMQQESGLNLYLADPLGASAHCAEALADLLQAAPIHSSRIPGISRSTASCSPHASY